MRPQDADLAFGLEVFAQVHVSVDHKTIGVESNSLRIAKVCFAANEIASDMGTFKIHDPTHDASCVETKVPPRLQLASVNRRYVRSPESNRSCGCFFEGYGLIEVALQKRDRTVDFGPL
jgi:hypothetical protein